VVRIGDAIEHVKGDTIIIATGAAENMVTFEGWTLPGVIGAGAAQTLMNLHGVLPGQTCADARFGQRRTRGRLPADAVRL
jgi:hypothetical protein